MTERTQQSCRCHLAGQPGRLLLCLGALCLLTMPQDYRGGASLPHPHAIFQFWTPGGHRTAADHHGHDHSYAQLSPAEWQAAARAARSDAPIITQLTPPGESGDAIGGVVEIWFVLLLGVSTAIYVLRALLPGLTRSPERPPPRSLAAFG
jgi:hypothetical protein